MNNDFLAEMHTLAVNNGGITFNNSVVNPSVGFMVSTPNFELIVDKEEFEGENFLNYLTKANELEHENMFIGVWFNEHDNKYYLDISELIVDKETALRQGMLRDQLAIYDNARQESIYLPSRQKSGTARQQQTYINMKVRQLL